MKKILWAALPHCPEEQLTKPGQYSDAGFDISAAEDSIILPYSQLEYTWEEVKPLIKFSGSVQKQLLDEGYHYTASGIFKIDNQGIVYRRKYKFPYIKTGIKLQPQDLMWTGIFSRSSCSKYGMGLANSVGIVDYAYGNEVLVALFAYNEPTLIKRGERIAQLVPMSQMTLTLQRVREEDITNTRGGFGSTNDVVTQIPMQYGQNINHQL